MKKEFRGDRIRDQQGKSIRKQQIESIINLQRWKSIRDQERELIRDLPKRGSIKNQQTWASVSVRFSKFSFRGLLPEGTIKLRFDSVWMGVTGGAMAGATSRGGVDKTLVVKNRPEFIET